MWKTAAVIGFWPRTRNLQCPRWRHGRDFPLRKSTADQPQRRVRTLFLGSLHTVARCNVLQAANRLSTTKPDMGALPLCIGVSSDVIRVCFAPVPIVTECN